MSALLLRHLRQACGRREIGLIDTAPRQLQEGLHQFTHFAGCTLDALQLFALARFKAHLFQQLAGGGDNHQRGTQFMADIAGKQPFVFQRLAQLPQRAVEGARQLTHLVIRVFRCQRRCRWQQLITMPDLLRQAAEGGHDASGHAPSEHPGAEDGQNEPGENDIK